jgi:high affinity Mn2+ porin
MDAHFEFLKFLCVKCVRRAFCAATAFILMADCLAAEVAVPGTMPRKAPPIVSYDWSGFYVGGHVGYSRGYGRDTLLDPGPSTIDSSFGSIFGGMQFGYNYVLPSRLHRN